MNVTLKSRVGPVSFKDTVRQIHPDGGVTYERQEFRFDFDNDFRAAVPREIWERIEGEYLDRKTGLRYADALIEL
jgi:hypothetical protein